MQHFVDNYEMDAMIVEVKAVATYGDAVGTERVDHFDNSAGERIASVSVAGSCWSAMPPTRSPSSPSTSNTQSR